MRTETSGNKP